MNPCQISSLAAFYDTARYERATKEEKSKMEHEYVEKLIMEAKTGITGTSDHSCHVEFIWNSLLNIERNILTMYGFGPDQVSPSGLRPYPIYPINFNRRPMPHFRFRMGQNTFYNINNNPHPVPSIYCLRLENGKYYVGKTNNLEYRIKQHFNGEGSDWTKINKPVDIHETHDERDEFDENNTTKKYMSEFGIDNVRGGSYCNVFLPDVEIRLLEKELKSANDECYKCGKSGHIAKNCKKTVTPIVCLKCGEIGHYANRCTFKGVICYKCNQPGHISTKCPNNNIICNRCGTRGHYSNTCRKRIVNRTNVENDIFSDFEIIG